MPLKLSMKNLSTIINKSVVNNLAVLLLGFDSTNLLNHRRFSKTMDGQQNTKSVLAIFMVKVFFNGNINDVLFLQLLS